MIGRIKKKATKKRIEICKGTKFFSQPCMSVLSWYDLLGVSPAASVPGPGATLSGVCC